MGRAVEDASPRSDDRHVLVRRPTTRPCRGASRRARGRGTPPWRAGPMTVLGSLPSAAKLLRVGPSATRIRPLVARPGMGPGARRAPVAMAVASDRQDDQGDQGQPDERAGGRDPAPHVSRGVHGKPPFGARPPRPLARRRGLHQDLAEVVGHAMPGLLVEPAREVLSERVVGGHAGRPSTVPGRSRESASSAARISPRARCRRDFAVPRGIPRVAATVGSGRSR